MSEAFSSDLVELSMCKLLNRNTLARRTLRTIRTVGSAAHCEISDVSNEMIDLIAYAKKSRTLGAASDDH
ncbi:hypothetical protein V2O64_24610 (plasmid) [Verrucomicrobiaceae bacterium 227]